MSEQKHEYAQRRANETGSAYLITGMGHVMWACAWNRRLAKNDLGGIDTVVRPLIPTYQKGVKS